MIEKLLPLLGKSIESVEIKALFAEFNWPMPTKTTCTANNSTIKGKFEKDGIILYFGRGGNSRYLKPIEAAKKGSYIGIFSMIEFTKKYKGKIPFDIKFDMKSAELTPILGEPKVDNFMGQTTTWRKNYTDTHEFIFSDWVSGDKIIRAITLSFKYESDLYSMEEYAKAGL
jgi:hypothetical protein